MIGHMFGPALPNASGSSGKGVRRRNWMVRSSGADKSSVAASKACPNVSRLPQRAMLATQSRASTGSPSWNRSPSRSASRQRRPPSSTVAPATICGCGRNALSWPYSVSNTMKAWLRVT